MKKVIAFALFCMAFLDIMAQEINSPEYLDALEARRKAVILKADSTTSDKRQVYFVAEAFFHSAKRYAVDAADSIRYVRLGNKMIKRGISSYFNVDNPADTIFSIWGFETWELMSCYTRFRPMIDTFNDRRVRHLAKYCTFYVGSTRNLEIMAAVAANLAVQNFGIQNVKKGYGGTTFNAKAGLDQIYNHVREWTNDMQPELSSLPYGSHNLDPLLTFINLSTDTSAATLKLKQRCLMVYEMAMVDYAVSYLKGHLAKSSGRTYPNNSAVGQLGWNLLDYLWFYFTAGDNKYVDSWRSRRPQVRPALQAAVNTPYILPEMIYKIAQNPNRYEFSTSALYMYAARSNMTLFTYRTPEYALYSSTKRLTGNGIWKTGVQWNLSDSTELMRGGGENVFWITLPKDTTNPRNGEIGASGEKEDVTQYEGTIAAVVNSGYDKGFNVLKDGYGFVPGRYRAAINLSATQNRIFLHYPNILIAVSATTPIWWNQQLPNTFLTTHFIIKDTTNCFGWVIETANPDDFKGATDSLTLDNFKKRILTQPLPQITGKANSPLARPRLYYKDWKNNTFIVNFRPAEEYTQSKDTINGVWQNYYKMPRLKSQYANRKSSADPLIVEIDGCKRVYDFKKLTITHTCQYNISPSEITSCVNDSVLIRTSAKTLDTTTYQWQISTFENGTYTAWQNLGAGANYPHINRDSLKIAPLSIGQYLARFRCVFTSTRLGNVRIHNSDTFRLTLNSPLSATATTASSPVYIGSVVELKGSATGGSGKYEYNWAGPDNFTSTQNQDVIYDFAVAQNGTYSLTVTDDIGCTAQANLPLQAIVSPNTPLKVTASASGTFKALSTLNLVANVSGGSGVYTQFRWEKAGKIVSTLQNPIFNTVSIDSSGIYWVYVTDNTGFTAYDTMTVEITKLPQTIYFNPIANQTYTGSESKIIPLLATSSSGLPVTFKTYNSILTTQIGDDTIIAARKRPDYFIELSQPIQTNKLKIFSNQSAHFHIREIRAYAPNNEGYPPNPLSETADTDVDFLVNHVQENKPTVSVSGIYGTSSTYQMSNVLDGKTTTSWVSQQVTDTPPEKWIQLDFPTTVTIGCLQFINGWYGSGTWNGLMTDIAVQTWNGANWVNVYDCNATIQAIQAGDNNYLADTVSQRICIMPIAKTVTNVTSLPFSGNVYLQGSYNTTTGLMNDDLRALNLVPTTEPYSALFTQVKGNNNAQTTPFVLATTGNTAIVDWVFLELRNATTPATVVATQSALVRRDGVIVDKDGNTILYFNTISEGDYFVAVRHRNHLGIRTNTPLSMTEKTTTTFDFTSTASSIYTNPSITTNAPTTSVTYNGNIFRALWTGDVNRDGFVKYNGSSNDRGLILTKVGSILTGTSSGYISEDINLNGIAKYNGSANDRAVLLTNVGGILTNVLNQHL